MDALYKLGVVLALEDRISGALQKIEQWSDKTTNAFKSLRVSVLAVSALAVGLGVAWGGAALAMAKVNAEFEQYIAQAAAIGGEDSAGKNLLRKLALDAKGVSPTAAAQAEGALASLGFGASAQRTVLPATLGLQRASGGDIGGEAAGMAVGGTLKAYSLGAEKAGIVADKLANISNLTALGFRDFSVAVSGAAAKGALFGQSLDDTLIGLGLLRNRNIDASSSMTDLNEALTRVATDPSAAKALKNLRVSAYDARGELRPLLDVMLDVDAALAGVSAQERNPILKDLFETRGLQAFGAVVGAGRAEVDRLRAAMAGSGGALDKYIAQVEATAKGMDNLIAGEKERFFIRVGAAVNELLMPLRVLALDVLGSLIGAWDGMSEQMRRALVLFPLATASVGGLVLALTALKVLLPILSGLLLGTPIGWVTLAVVGLGAALTALVVYWDDIGKALVSVYERFGWVKTSVDFLVGAFRFLYDVGSMALAGLVGFVSHLWDSMKTFGRLFSQEMAAWWKPIGDTIDNALAGMRGIYDWLGRIADRLSRQGHLLRVVVPGLDAALKIYELAKSGTLERIPSLLAQGVAGSAGYGQEARNYLSDAFGFNDPEAVPQQPFGAAPASQNPLDQAAGRSGFGGRSGRGSGDGEGSGGKTVERYALKVEHFNLSVHARDVLEADTVERLFYNLVRKAAHGHTG